MRYLYQETTEEEKREIDKALKRDKELQAVFTELMAVKKGLDSAKLEPSSKTVLNILNYSRSTSPGKS